MFCRKCGTKLREEGRFCPKCGIEQEIPNLVNNPKKVESRNNSEFTDNIKNDETLKKPENVNNNKSSNVETEYSSDNKTTEELYNINKKIDDFIENIEKRNKEKPFIENLKYLLDVVCINRNVPNLEITETFKNICEKSGIDCKIIDYKNDKKNLYYKLNIVFDNDKKYYVDPDWGFFVEDLETLKQIYRGEINNPRTNTKIGNNEAEYSTGNIIKDDQNPKDTKFMTIVIFSMFVVILFLLLIFWLNKN